MKLQIFLFSFLYCCSATAMDCENQNVEPIDPAIANALSAACDRLENNDVKLLVKVASSAAILFVPRISDNIDTAAKNLTMCCRQAREELANNQLNRGGTVQACESFLTTALRHLCFIKRMVKMWTPFDSLDYKLSASLHHVFHHDNFCSTQAKKYLAMVDEWKIDVENACSDGRQMRSDTEKLIERFNIHCLSLQIQLRYRPEINGALEKMNQIGQLQQEIQANCAQS